MSNYEYWAELNEAEYELVVDIINWRKNDERSLRARMLKMLHQLPRDSNSLAEVAKNLGIIRNELITRIILFYEQKFQKFITPDNFED